MQCKICQSEEVYGSGNLTNGLCLNCYQDNEREKKLMEIEAEKDYDDEYLELGFPRI